MFDESPDKESTAPKDEITSVSDVITDLLADTAIPSIPGPVRRNLFKALGQLCSAAIDIPNAYLTGIADERRAETSARIKLINVSAEQIARQMQTDPDYARIAAQKFGQRVIREQVNLDLISQKAAKEIVDANNAFESPEKESSDETISEDWLNAFETEARQKSTEEMQTFFGKVLAGEIRRPGSYTTMAVRILGSLDQKTANHFVKLGSMCIASHSEDIRVPSMGGNAGKNALQEYGLNFATLNVLNEYGLIISDYNSWWEHIPCVAVPSGGQQSICIPFIYQGSHWILMPKDIGKVGKKLRVSGVALTQSGRELFRIVKVEPVPNYSQELAKFFESKGYRMIEVGDAQPRAVSVGDSAEINS